MGVPPARIAPVEVSSTVCEAHDTTEGLCDHCGRDYAVAFAVRCSNCVYEIRTVSGMDLLAKPDLREFMTD